jgi:hypothetical protein
MIRAAQTRCQRVSIFAPAVRQVARLPGKMTTHMSVADDWQDFLAMLALAIGGDR